MNEPRFLSLTEVHRIHERSLERYGGAQGVRDEGGVLSALDQPKHTFYYGRGDLFDIAAAYAFHLAQCQAFLDGNKRTGMGCALAFLSVNGVGAKFDPNQLYDAMIGIAEHRIEKEELATILRDAAQSP